MTTVHPSLTALDDWCRQTARPDAPRWEYAYLVRDIESPALESELLNLMGRYGWELVGAELLAGIVGGARQTRYVFKRPAA